MFSYVDNVINILPDMGLWKVKLFINCYQIFETDDSLFSNGNSSHKKP